MQEPESTVGEVDQHLQIMVRLWRWDRIGGRTTACRRDLLELDQLLDRRLERNRHNAQVRGHLAPARTPESPWLPAECDGSRDFRPGLPQHADNADAEGPTKAAGH